MLAIFTVLIDKLKGFFKRKPYKDLVTRAIQKSEK